MAETDVDLSAVAARAGSNDIQAMDELPTTEQTAPAGKAPPKHRNWAIWAALACMLFGAGYVLSQRSSGSASSGGKKGKSFGGGAIPVSVSTVTQGNIGVYVAALGTVTPVYTATVTSRVAGELMEVHYREGQMVHKGQLLAVIDPRPYQATYTQAQGQLQRDEALLSNARLDLARYETAFEQHAIPEQQLATQRAAVNQDEGTIKLDQGNLDAAKVNVEYTQITAPISGRVGLRAVDPGNIVQANGAQPLLTITQLQPITVIFTIAEDYISEIANQMRAGHKLQVDALDRDNETMLAHGTLLTLDNQIDTSTGTVRARATFANRDNALFPNEFVNAKLLVRTLNDVNLIPTAAIQRNNDVAFVYVVNNAQKTVRSRNINVATTDGYTAAVTGVSPGEVLVTDGFDKLQDGTKVVLRKPQSAAPAPPNSEAAEQNQAATQTQPPDQGSANKHLNTAQQNPQQPQTSQPHPGRHR
ncbi:MAG: efflux RND transporter periplasmic adaptor subunit [Acidobacteriaceae bacterium]|nr:efflux RND transporter periplasmic adaptor subunit [Acidobacteriaceae bacterium]